jgi:hypothetical protein
VQVLPPGLLENESRRFGRYSLDFFQLLGQQVPLEIHLLESNLACLHRYSDVTQGIYSASLYLNGTVASIHGAYAVLLYGHLKLFRHNGATMTVLVTAMHGNFAVACSNLTTGRCNHWVCPGLPSLILWCFDVTDHRKTLVGILIVVQQQCLTTHCDLHLERTHTKRTASSRYDGTSFLVEI